MLGSATRRTERPRGYRLITCSGRDEVDGLGGGRHDRVPVHEPEHPNPGDELTLKLRSAKFAGKYATFGHFAGLGARHFGEELALQRGIVPEGPAANRMDRQFVLTQDRISILPPRALAARSAPQ